MDARALELLNLELDGRLDDADRGELDALLVADPALQAHRAQLQRMARALAQAPAPDVPLDFADGVLRRARLPQPARRAPLRGRWRGGLALAASVLVAVVVLRVTDPQPATGPEQLSGALAPALPAVTAAPRAGGLALTFQVPAGPADIVIEFEGAGPLSATAEAGPAPRVEGRRIVVGAVGAGRTTVVVTGEVGAFQADLVRNGAVTHVTVREP